MIRENQKQLNNFNVFTDAVVFFVSILLAYFIRFNVFQAETGHLSLTVYIQYSALLIPVYLLIYSGFDLYDSFRSRRFTYEFGLIVKSNVAGFILFMALLFIFKEVDVSRWTLAFFFVINTFLSGCKRFFLRRILRSYRSKGYNQKHVLVIGSGASAQNYIKTILKNKQLGYVVAGYVAEGGVVQGQCMTVEGREFECLATAASLERFLDEQFYDEIICALDPAYIQLLPDIILATEKGGQRLCMIPFYYDILPARPHMDDVEGVPMMNLLRTPLDNASGALLKRLIDIVGSLVLVVLTSPLMLVAVIGTKLSSPGPVIFKQVRVGRNKEEFTMYKFRSMRVNIAENSGWTTKDDPRKTAFGSFIRKFSIDELPQFFNVLKGDMSLVGPRPEVPHFVERFRETIPLYMLKHQVRPGITGWSQVNGLRGDTSIEERIKYDLYYIENWSLMLDIKILLMTVFGGAINSEKLKTK